MKLLINGELKDLKENISVEELIVEFSLLKNSILVELNNIILESKDFKTIFLKENDKIELVKIVGGG